LIMPGPPQYPIEGLKRGFAAGTHIPARHSHQPRAGRSQLRAEAAQTAMNTAANAIATDARPQGDDRNEKLLELVGPLGEYHRRRLAFTDGKAQQH